jgi:hypothetical protein
MRINRSNDSVATRFQRWGKLLMYLGAFWESMLVAVVANPVPGAPTPPPPPVVMIDGQPVQDLGFEHLSSFPYTIVDCGTGATTEQIDAARKNDQVPAAIRAFDSKRVALTGYMLPLQIENGRAKKLILMRDVTTCCYGATPNMNDYVVVTMKGEGVKAVQDIPVVLVGVLRVGEKYENGYLVSLYELEGEKFLGPKK